MPALTLRWLKDELQDLVFRVKDNRPGLILSSCIIFVFLVGLLLGLATSQPPCSGPECQVLLPDQPLLLLPQVPVYYFLTSHSSSCPALTGERLITEVQDGQSFEGLTVSLQVGHSDPLPRTPGHSAKEASPPSPWQSDVRGRRSSPGPRCWSGAACRSVTPPLWSPPTTGEIHCTLGLHPAMMGRRSHPPGLSPAPGPPSTPSVVFSVC